MVYTEEEFYYEEDIHVIARQNYLNSNATCLTFYMDGDFWFSFEIEDSIYTMQGIRALLIYKMKERGHTPEFKYSRKRIEYSCSEKQILDTVDFYITESNQPGVLSVMEQINHSKHLRAWNFKTQFYDFTGIRQFTDSIFYSTFVKQG
jgi:hypothetical protein